MQHKRMRRNFVMALPLELLITGPLTRAIFRAIFSKEEERRMDAELEAEHAAEAETAVASR